MGILNLHPGVIFGFPLFMYGISMHHIGADCSVLYALASDPRAFDSGFLHYTRAHLFKYHERDWIEIVYIEFLCEYESLFNRNGLGKRKREILM